MTVQQTLGERVRRLEYGLDIFEGEEWILRVGDIAMVKSVILDMAEAEERHGKAPARYMATGQAQCAQRVDDTSLSRLDALIEEVTTESRTPAQRRQAFDQACALLRSQLDAVIGERRGQ